MKGRKEEVREGGRKGGKKKEDRPLSWLLFPTPSSAISSFTNSVQSLSHVQLFETQWTPARQASLSITNSRNSLKLMSIESVMPSNHLNLCLPLLLLPSIFPSIRVISNESVFPIRWPKYWSFSFSISSSSEYSGLISFRLTGWISLPSKGFSGVFSNRRSAFFIVQLSHPYMTTGKTIALTRQIFVGKVMSLLFNTLSRFAIAFLPRSKHLLISWMQSPSAVILEPEKIKSVTVSIVCSSICMK